MGRLGRRLKDPKWKTGTDDVANALTWLLAAELIGLIAFPLAFILFSGLKDRGYSVAKPLGLILLSWPLWMLGSLHIVPTTPLTLGPPWACSQSSPGGSQCDGARRCWISSAGRGAPSCWGIGVPRPVRGMGHLPSLRPLHRFHRKADGLRILNASILPGFFPPEDPWLRGHDLPYYYFGYLMMGNLTELTFIPSRISYTLPLALIPADGRVRRLRPGVQPDAGPRSLVS